MRLAQAIAHDPEILVLDEPLNGLDPLVRAETIALFREFLLPFEVTSVLILIAIMGAVVLARREQQ